jgi:hypothetical protein
MRLARPLGRKLRAVACSALCLTAASASYGAAGDNVTTQKKVVSEVLISTGPSGSFYYVKADGGWSTTGCSGVIYAYINQSAPGADAVLSAVLAARSTGKPIGFSGICGDTAGSTQYIQIRTVYF